MNPKEIRAVSVALMDAGRFLLVQRARAPAMGLYAFPGGRIEEGETAQAAARRELFEETGLSARTLSHIRDFILPAGEMGTRFRLSVFRASHADGFLRAGDDAAKAGWFTLEAMRRMAVTESTLDLAEEIAAGSHP